MTLDLIKRVFKYTKHERLMRLATLAGKQLAGTIDPFEEMEVIMIQSIRQENGEIDEIIKGWETAEELNNLNKNQNQST